MPSFTDRLSLLRHTLGDVFRIADYEDNWERLDQFPGTFICTSSTRPINWGERQEGQMIFETDTNLIWHWNGDSWVRRIPTGLLNYQALTTTVNTSDTALQVVITAITTIPAGNRRVRVSVGASRVYNTNDLTRVAIRRDGTTLSEWRVQGGTGGTPQEQPRHLDRSVYDIPTAGSKTYTLEYSVVSGVDGQSTIEGDANNPIFLAVEDV